MGVLRAPVEAFAAMLAQCRGFSDWLGLPTFDPTEAARRIYFDGVGVDIDAEAMSRSDLEELRPYVILYMDGGGHVFKRDAAPNCWTGNGGIVAVFSRRYDEALTISEHWTRATDAMEPIISTDDANVPGLLELSGTAGYLHASEIRVSIAGRTPLEARPQYGDAFDVVLYVGY